MVVRDSFCCEHGWNHRNHIPLCHSQTQVVRTFQHEGLKKSMNRYPIKNLQQSRVFVPIVILWGAGVVLAPFFVAQGKEQTHWQDIDSPLPRSRYEGLKRWVRATGQLRRP